MSFVLIRECASSIINKIDRKINIAGPKNIILKGSAKKQKEGELVMRLNKKKLAAVMMSAVMAASVMPVTAFAEGNADFAAAPAAEVAATSNETITLVEGSVSWDVENSKMTYSAQEGSKVTEYTASADKTDEKAANCTTPGSCTMTGKTYWGKVISETVKTEDALGHEWAKELKRVETTAPSCDAKGEATLYKTCTRCTHEELDHVEEIPMAQHSFGGEIKTKYVAGDNTRINAEGKPELIDKTKDGKYVEVTYQLCQLCEKVESKPLTEVTKTLEASENAKIHHNSVKAKDNIATAIDGMTYEAVQKLSNIELKDCYKDGKYVVTYYGDEAETKVISTKEVVVPAHHSTKKEVEFKVAADKNLCTVTTDAKTGDLIVKNKSCNKPVIYYVVEKCTVSGCKLYNKVVDKSEELTAEPMGAHAIAAKAQEAVDTAKAAAAANKGVLTKTAYDALVKVAKDTKKLDVVTTAACEAEGTVTVTYLCDVCGEPTGTPVTLKVEKLGHDLADPVADETTRVEPTCDTEGSYDAVVYCKRCKEEVSRQKGVKIPALGHKFDDKGTGIGLEFAGGVVVTRDNYLKKGDEFTSRHDFEDETWYETVTVGDFADYAVVAKAYDTCKTCGAKVSNPVAELTVKVVDVVKQDGKGNPGSITLKATYTTPVDGKDTTFTVEDTFNYFSNWLDFINRNPEEDALDGLHKDEDGVWRYYVNDVFQEDYVGIVEFEGGEFFVANGVLCSEAEGLNQNIDGKWYFLSQGQIQRVDGFAEYDNAWFMLKNGELDLNANGLYGYNGGTFLFAAGKLRTDYSGLWQNPATQEWVFLANGQLQDQYTGIAKYDGHEFKLVNGKLVA